MRTIGCLSIAGAFVLLLSGCVSLDGRGLVPGKSTGTEVQSSMGAPAERVKRPNGDEVWYYPRLPEGRATYAVSVSADGVMQGIEQRLNRNNFAKVVVDKSTRDQVRELLGPPAHILHMWLKTMDVWEYPWLEIDDKRVLLVSFSGDGVVREIKEMHDLVSDKPSLSD